MAILSYLKVTLKFFQVVGPQTIADFKSEDLKSGLKSDLPDLTLDLSHFQKAGLGLIF